MHSSDQISDDEEEGRGGRTDGEDDGEQAQGYEQDGVRDGGVDEPERVRHRRGRVGDEGVEGEEDPIGEEADQRQDGLAAPGGFEAAVLAGPFDVFELLVSGVRGGGGREGLAGDVSVEAAPLGVGQALLVDLLLSSAWSSREKGDTDLRVVGVELVLAELDDLLKVEPGGNVAWRGVVHCHLVSKASMLVGGRGGQGMVVVVGEEGKRGEGEEKATEMTCTPLSKPPFRWSTPPGRSEAARQSDPLDIMISTPSTDFTPTHHHTRHISAERRG